jgi:hypothetical protein
MWGIFVSALIWYPTMTTTPKLYLLHRIMPDGHRWYLKHNGTHVTSAAYADTFSAEAALGWIKIGGYLTESADNRVMEASK